MNLALESPAAKRSLYLLGLCGAVRGLALLLIAQGVAGGIVTVIDGTGGDWWQLGLLGAALRALEAWAVRFIATRSAQGVKEEWRRRLTLRSLVGGGRDLGTSTGALATLATRGLDELDDFFTSALPALMASATVPLVLLVRIATVDLVSTLVLVLTLPLVPVFMILIGRYTQERIERAQRALERLSTNLVELVRGLPVLIGLGRAKAQAESLRRITEEYRASTVATLRIAFLSALALELIASIAVAMVAVFIGVRLVNGSLDLQTGMIVLILAPEVFLPLRQLGSSFHASENGRAAHERVRALTERAAAADPRGVGGTEIVVVRNLTVRYPGRAADAVSGVSLRAAPGRLHLLDGASGAGKSTVLGVLAGLQREGVSGEITGVDPGGVAYLGQAPQFVEPSAAADVAAFVDSEDPALVAEALRRAQLPSGGADPAVMSPGELRRLGLARIFARVADGARLVLLDEPTAHLDAETAAAVIGELRSLGPEVVVVLATHDPRLRALADDTTVLGAEIPAEAAAEVGEAPVPDRPVMAEKFAATPPSRPELLRRWRAITRPESGKMLGAVAFGTAAALSAAALTAVSGWLIVRAAEQPPIMLLLVAIVGVRFFGLARAVFRYAERLWLHDAVLASLGRLRLMVWNSFARRGTANRALLHPEATLRAMVSELDDIRDLTPRVVLPPVIAVVVATAATATGFLIHPIGGLLIGGASLAALVLGSWAAVMADRLASAQSLAARGGVLGRLSRLLSAREDIAANGRAEAFSAELEARDRLAESLSARAARAAGVGQAVVVACCVAAAVLAPVLLGPMGVPGGPLAVVSLVPLALVDTYGEAALAIQRAPALGRMLAAVDLDLGGEEGTGARNEPGVGDGKDHPRNPETAQAPEPVDSLVLDDVAARWPGAARPVFEGVSLRMNGGGWARISGPSGSGKSTLVSLVLRFLDPETGRYLLNGRDALGLAPDDLRGRIAWCPQEAHIFDSSLRANLLLARGREQAPTDEEMWAVLHRLDLADTVSSWPEGLDARLGPGGSLVSGGQRQRIAVARTLLAGASVVVLDEPAAHLDRPMARAMMADLRRALNARLVIEVTHDALLAQSGDEQVRLGAGLSPSSRRT